MLPKRPGDSLSLENLKTLLENHQFHTVWLSINVEACQATGMSSHLWATTLWLYNKHKHTKPYPLSNILDRTLQLEFSSSHYHPSLLSSPWLGGRGGEKRPPPLMFCKQTPQIHFLSEERHAIQSGSSPMLLIIDLLEVPDMPYYFKEAL